jgi:UDPglucose 6-dehydrogenase
MEQAKIFLPDIAYCDGPFSAAEGAHALVIVTEWEQFRALDLNRLKKVMASPIIVDLRNIYDPEELGKEGFVYDSVGRPNGSGGDRRGTAQVSA